MEIHILCETPEMDFKGMGQVVRNQHSHYLILDAFLQYLLNSWNPKERRICGL